MTGIAAALTSARARAVRGALAILAAAVLVAGGTEAGARREADIGTVALAQLPRQAGQTFALIERGGPFPYERDGVEFRNYERRLPLRRRGYYHEYTVPTPGLAYRGARRLIVGCAPAHPERTGALFPRCAGPATVYYTADHYRTFHRVVR